MIYSLVPINIAITSITDAISIGVFLRGVPYARTVVARVACAVIVHVLLRRVVAARTVVHLVYYTWKEYLEFSNKIIEIRTFILFHSSLV